jgi:hypothetical protein
VSRHSPVSGWRSPSTRTIPCKETDAWRRRRARIDSSPPGSRSRSTRWRHIDATRARSDTEWVRAASTSCDSTWANASGSASWAATRHPGGREPEVPRFGGAHRRGHTCQCPGETRVGGAVPIPSGRW